jgi:cytochrome b involved in lipid metabolism
MSHPGAAAAGAGAAAPGPALATTAGGDDELPALTRAEVAAFDTRLLVIVGEGVYDVTEFSHVHPGGKAMLDSFAGRDGTDAFDSIHSHHPASKARAILATLKVARLAPPTRKPAAGAGADTAPATASPAGGSGGR